ncbi:MAG: leucine-rich repeat domain-containing protein [Alphaproteobacteria bacterium]|nr:leucine-rich repeat domain-containing protein [Alphaproteobacteria bacterium]
MRNKIFISLLALTTTLSTNVWAASSGICGPRYYDSTSREYLNSDTCTYTIDDDGLMIISGTGTYTGKGDHDLEWLRGVKSIVVNEGITKLDFDSFMGALNVTSVSLPDSLTKIDDQVFTGMGNLKSIVIPSHVTEIGYQEFAQTGLESIIIPNSVTSLGNSFFSGATSLTSVTIPDTITSLGDYFFDGTTSLTNLTIPESVTSIGYQAFYNSGLESLVIPESVTSIGAQAFEQSNLNSLVIEGDASAFNDSVFYNIGRCIGGGCTSANNKDVTIYCKTDAGCDNKSLKDNVSLVSFEKDINGVYKVGENYFSSPENMASQTACSNLESCTAEAAVYKENKAASMAGGALCATKQECLNLMDMVSGLAKDENGNSFQCGSNTANTIANCSAYAKSNYIQLADLFIAEAPISQFIQNETPTAQESGNATNHNIKRIYTIEEAEKVSKKTGNTFRLRYK